MDKSVIFLIIIILVFSMYRVSSLEEKKYLHNSFVNPQHNLLRLLDNISLSDKVILKNVHERWSLTKQTIDVDLNEKITNLMKKILLSMKHISTLDFYIKSIENVYVMKDKNENFRCIVNSFIYDIQNYYTIKLVLDFSSISGTIYLNYMDIDSSSLNNLLNRYDIRWDSQGILSKYNMFDENVEKLLNNYYDKNYNLLKLDNNSFTQTTMNTFTLDQLTNMYLPVDTPHVNSQDFCKKHSFTWDSRAVPISTGENCPMHNPRKSPYPYQPYQAPGNVITPWETLI
jgi:hypothetical protein